MRYQPVPDPGNWDGLFALLDTGVLIDLGGRPLTLVDCQWCGGPDVSGSTCPQSISCPVCRRQPGQKCARPSGHVLSGTSGLHKPRGDEAARIDKQRELAGDPTLAAPWPTKPAPSPAAVAAQQLDLFDGTPWGALLEGVAPCTRT